MQEEEAAAAAAEEASPAEDAAADFQAEDAAVPVGAVVQAADTVHPADTGARTGAMAVTAVQSF